jgi:predicted metalloprotease with PDZ domain
MILIERIAFRSLVILLLILLFAVSSVAQCRFPSSRVGRSLTFSFVPESTAAGAVLHVTVQFQGNSMGFEQIEIPVAWADEKLNAVSNLRAASASTIIEDDSRTGEKTIRYPPKSTVVLAYDLSKDWAGPLVHPFQFHPVVMPDYFEINGDNALVVPKLPHGAVVTANFDFHELPSDWSLATSLGAPQDRREYCQTSSGAGEQVLFQALFAAGDFRIHRFHIGRRDAALAVRGKWTFTDEQAVEEIRKIVGVVREFWHDDHFPYFLVTLKPYDQDHGSSDGSAFTNAFWVYMSRLDPIETQLTLLAHESFHAWNPRRMGPYESYRAFDWFKEGFTQYYAYKLVYLAGLMPLSAYIESLNRDLRLYPGSNDPYIRGRGIALWLDGEIRSESNGKKSLDDVMLDMVRTADKPLTLERILQTAGRYLPPPARRQLEAAANQGEVLLPAADAALPSCAVIDVSMEQLPVFDLGFDFAASRVANRVIGVREDGPAWRAGLRDGQTLKRISVYNGQPDRQATFGITQDGQTQTIQYYPRGKTVSAPQFHLDSAAFAARPGSCRNR